MPGIIENLTLFDASNLLRKALLELKTSENKPAVDLLALKQSIIDREEPWTKEAIEGLMKEFYDHESLFDEDGKKRESLAPESRLVKYLSDRHDADPVVLKSALYQIAELLCEASVATIDRREAFFAGFPPADLHCLGGNNSRIEEDIRALRSSGINGDIISAYNTVRAQMVERVKGFDHAGNEEHIRRYLEYLLSLQTEEEVKRLDGMGFLSAKTIPASVAKGIVSDFYGLFKYRLAKEIEDGVLTRVLTVYRSVVEEVNSDPEIEGSQLPESLGAVRESQFFGISEKPNFRYASVVAKLGERLRLDNVTEFFDETTQDRADLSSQDESSQKITYYKINREKIKDVLLERRYDEFRGILGIQEKGEIPAGEFTEAGRAKRRRVSGVVAEAAAAMDVDVAEKAPDITDEIEVLLKSGNKSDNVRAIEILYILSNPSLGFTPILFVDILSRNDNRVRKMLNSFLVQKNLPENYLEKITSAARSEAGAGFFEKYAEYQKLKDATIGDDSKQVSLVVALFGGAKESAEKIIDVAGSIDDVLREDEFNVVGYKIRHRYEALKHLLFRNDISQILQNIIVEINKGEFSRDLNEALDEFMVDMLEKAIKYKLNDVVGVIAKHLGKEKLEDPELYRYGFLYLAIKEGNLDVLEMLQASGMDLDKKRDNRTPLYFAIESENKGAVRALLDLDADVNIPGPSGQTPIYKAASIGDKEIFDILINSDQVEINRKTRDGDTVISIAILGYRINDGYDSAIVYDLIDRDDINLNEVNYLGQAPLHMSCEFDDYNIMRRLIVRHVDLDLQDDNGQTALHHIAMKVHSEAYGFANFKVIEEGIKILVDAGADISKKNSAGQTAFDIISKAGAFCKSDRDSKARILEMLKVRSAEAQSSDDKSTQSLPDGWDRGDGAGPAPDPRNPAGGARLVRRHAGEQRQGQQGQ